MDTARPRRDLSRGFFWVRNTRLSSEVKLLEPQTNHWADGPDGLSCRVGPKNDWEGVDKKSAVDRHLTQDKGMMDDAFVS
jgi:hypothetical protein